MTSHRRRVRLIQPRLQLRLILVFLGLSVLGLVLQVSLFTMSLTQLAAELPSDGSLVLEHAPGLVLAALGVTLCVVLPLVFFVGVLVTFRVAGPLYRFQRHFEALARGEDPGPCRIRRGDDLQDLCTTINAGLDRMRADAAGAEPEERRAEAA